MTTHDVGHFGPVRRAARRRVDDRGGLTKKRRTDRGGRDGAEDLHVLAAVVVESMNRASGNAERLSRPDVDPAAVDSPGQYALDAVNRFFVVIVAVRRRREPLSAGNREL